MSQPNIIVIITDDMPAEAIQRMPALFSRLSNHGVLFSRCFTATSLCQPGRATIQTGQFAHNHGLFANNESYLSLPQNDLLGPRMQAAGYKTSYIGKYMNSYSVADPVPQGWTNWYGLSPQDYYNYSVNDNGSITAKGAATADYQTTVVTQKALSLIASETEPFFMMLGYCAPHYGVTGNVGSRFELDVHPDYANCVPPSKTFPKDPSWSIADVTAKPDYVKVLPPIDAATENSINSFWRQVTEALFSVNKSVNQIVDALTAAGKYNETVIIFVADNGTVYGEQRITTGKVVPYEHSINIPLIVSGPPSIVAQNKTCSHLVSHVDLCATIYDLAGATSTILSDGVSIVPYLQDPTTGNTLRDYVFLEWVSPDATPAMSPIYRAVRSHDWKYIKYATGETELYNLRSDPYEVTNVASLPENAGIVAALSALIAQGASCSGEDCIL